MEQLQELIDRYLSGWNETDPERRRELIAAAWSEAGSYADPVLSATGHAELDGMLAAVQARFPGFRIRQTGAPDAFGNRFRFTWELGPEGAEAPIAGTDFGMVAADGRLQSITGFFDRVPEGS